MDQTEEQITLTFRMFDTTTGPILEVVGSGPYVENRIEKIATRVAHVKGAKSLVLGSFDEHGVFWDEFSFDLDIDHPWIWESIPSAVAHGAWGKNWIRKESRLP
jgi:hypothetical protein